MLISLPVVGFTNMLREEVTFKRVMKLHDRDVSARQITQIQKIGGLKLIERLSEYDSRYIETLLDVKLRNVSIMIFCVIWVAVNTEKNAYTR